MELLDLQRPMRPSGHCIDFSWPYQKEVTLTQVGKPVNMEKIEIWEQRSGWHKGKLYGLRWTLSNGARSPFFVAKNTIREPRPERPDYVLNFGSRHPTKVAFKVSDQIGYAGLKFTDMNDQEVCKWEGKAPRAEDWVEQAIEEQAMVVGFSGSCGIRGSRSHLYLESDYAQFLRNICLIVSKPERFE